MNNINVKCPYRIVTECPRSTPTGHCSKHVVMACPGELDKEEQIEFMLYWKGTFELKNEKIYWNKLKELK